MAIQNRKCYACQQSYSYCPNCSGSDKLAPSWKAQFCSESCVQLWTTLTKYNMNLMNKPEAKEIISGLDLKPLDVYVACVQRDYEKVMTEDKKPKRGKRAELKLYDEAAQFELDEVVTIENE